ncbi:Ger(x)C family spore germination protein [Paenibacillus silviterrae]|uniref:Ger(x)C family spore germination protein n=1 Tax=Paenibacillus silviterrae TaxID=3242194 RepID=UPI002543B5D5|nr:Ger(x)C family spore germination protein [Paenibacillus chinjuensis]
MITMNWRRLKSLPLLVMCVMLLPGCWDRTEINDMAFILASSVDLEQDGKVRFSVLVPLPGQMGGATGGGGGTGGEKSYYIDSETGVTIREAQGKLQQRMPRRMFLAHRRVFLVSEDFARKGIKDLYDTLPRTPESRLSGYMVVTKGPAHKMLLATPKFERFPSEAIRELAKGPYIMNISMKNVGVALAAPGSDPIAAYMEVKESEKSEKTSKEVNVLGFAMFKGDKMVGTLESDVASGLAWLMNQRIVAPITLKLEDQAAISLRIYNTESNMNVKIQEGKLKYQLEVLVRAKMMENWSSYDLSQTSPTKKVENALAEHIKNSIQDALSKSIKQQSDPAQLGNALFRSYPALWEQSYAKTWPAPLQDAEFDINVKTVIAENGLIHQNIVKGGTQKQ